MAKIQPFKRLIKEDVDEKYRDLIDKIGSSINLFADDVYNAFNKGISIEDNLNQTKKNFKVIVDSDGVPTSALSFKSGLTKACYGIQVVKVINNTNPVGYPSGQPFLSYSENNSVITVNKISNLQISNQYTVYLILYS